MESNIEGNLVESDGPVGRLWVCGSDSARVRQACLALLSLGFLVDSAEFTRGYVVLQQS